jgi:hypothetical protein
METEVLVVGLWKRDPVRAKMKSTSLQKIVFPAFSGESETESAVLSWRFT